MFDHKRASYQKSINYQVAAKLDDGGRVEIIERGEETDSSDFPFYLCFFSEVTVARLEKKREGAVMDFICLHAKCKVDEERNAERQEKSQNYLQQTTM